MALRLFGLVPIVLAAACLSLPVRAAAQPRPPAPRAKTVDTLEQYARRIVAAAGYATFISTEADGAPQARTVQPQPPDSTWTVWIATNPRTRKVAQVERDPRVVLHYFDVPTLSFVALSGSARVIRDRATKDAHWAPAWTAFYPDRDSSVVLIAVTAERLELASATLPIASDPVTWHPPTVRLRAPTTPRRP